MECKLLLALLVATASAFLGPRSHVAPPRAPTARWGVYEDAVAEAEAAAKQFGAKSPEATTAWAEVEEIEAADNSATLTPTLDEECDPASPECRQRASGVSLDLPSSRGGPPGAARAVVLRRSRPPRPSVASP